MRTIALAVDPVSVDRRTPEHEGRAAMCCFSQPVELVAQTNIFDRAANGRQFLVYSMSYAASSGLAMVLPLPVPPDPGEEAVGFINLERYPKFFDDMRRGFPPRLLIPRGLRAKSREPPKLRVHDVGDFEASFVPQIEDFDRLDERFRIPADVGDRLPAYRDYGFAAFKPKASHSRRSSGIGRGSGSEPAGGIEDPSACIRWLSLSPGETRGSCTSRPCTSMIEEFTRALCLSIWSIVSRTRDRGFSSGLGSVSDEGVEIHQGRPRRRHR